MKFKTLLPLLILTACASNNSLDSSQEVGTEAKAPTNMVIQKPLAATKSQVGHASYYSTGFHGKRTANGSVFDQNAYTAAHKDLPMPSVVRVTNLENNRSVVVVVNDRGPFHKGRIIDLSHKAAQDLGMLRKGASKVKVDYLPHETKKLIARLPAYKETKSAAAFNSMVKSFAAEHNRG